MYILAKINSSNTVEEILNIGESFQNLNEQQLIEKFSLSGNWKLGHENSIFGQGFRKNFPQIGFSFDESKDAFVWPKRYQSWILNETTFDWNAPIPKPNDGYYAWREALSNWEKIE